MIGKRLHFVILILVCSSLCFMTNCMNKKKPSQDRSRLHLMPWPANLTVESGMLRLDSGFKVTWEGFQEQRLSRAVD